MDSVAALAPAPDPATKPAGKPHFWEKEDFSFHDVLDAINPLQHLPVIGSIYRAITGDELGNVPRLIGSLLYGGPIGFTAGIVQVGLKEETGKDAGEHVLAALGFEPASADPPPVYADAPQENAAKPVGQVDVRLEQSAAPSPAPATPEQPAAVAPSKPPAIEVRPDHPPMPLYRNGAGVGRVERSAPVPLQTATPVPRPRNMSVSAASVDVPGQMMDALDKYARMQATRGGRVDLTQ
jgi:hypothetical protein